MFKNTTINSSGKSTHIFFIIKTFRENILVIFPKCVFICHLRQHQPMSGSSMHSPEDAIYNMVYQYVRLLY